MSFSHVPDPEEKALLPQNQIMSTDRFLAVMQGTADLFWILTSTGEMCDRGPNWSSFTGQTERDASGHGWLEAVYSSDRPRIEALLTHAMHSDQAFESECHIYRQDGIYRLMHLHVFPVCTVAGTACEIVISGVDITREQMNEAQIHLAMEVSGVGSWQHDLATWHLVASEQWKRLCGFTPDAPVTYEAFLALVHPDDRARIEEVHARAEQTPCIVQFRVIWPDGSLHWITSQLQYFADVPNQSGHLIGSSIDITALKEAEEQVTNILESITDAFLHLDREWRVTYANHRVSALTGLNWGIFVGQSFWHVLPQLQNTLVEQHLRTARETQVAAHFDFFTPHINKWAEVHAYPMKQEGLSLYVRDITERKHAEAALYESESRFRHLRDSNLIGIIIHDLEGNILESNNKFLSLIDATREELTTTGLNLNDLTPGSYHASDKQADEELLATGTYMPFEKIYQTKEGRQVPVVVGGTSVRSENFSSPLILAFILDITAQKEVERQKEFFLGMASHELKTPLAALKGTFQLVQRKEQRLLSTMSHIDPEILAFLEILQKHLSNSVRLVDAQTRIINDLLDVSRIQTNTLALAVQPCDLVNLVKTTVEDLRMVFLERVLLLELPEQTVGTVLADQDRIRQVIANYVTNAVRYSPASQPVEIGLMLHENVVRVWVRDQGPGLTEEAQKDIWQCYHQVKGVPAQSSSEKGLGLGLYICQMLIRQQQGDIGVESLPGKGSTFWFTLPIVA